MNGNDNVIVESPLFVNYSVWDRGSCQKSPESV